MSNKVAELSHAAKRVVGVPRGMEELKKFVSDPTAENFVAWAKAFSCRHMTCLEPSCPFHMATSCPNGTAWGCKLAMEMSAAVLCEYEAGKCPNDCGGGPRYFTSCGSSRHSPFGIGVEGVFHIYSHGFALPSKGLESRLSDEKFLSRVYLKALEILTVLEYHIGGS